MDNTTEAFVNNSNSVVRGTVSMTTGVWDTFYISLSLMYIPGFVTNIISLTVLSIEMRRSKGVTQVLLFSLCFVDLIAVCNSAFWHVSRRLGMELTYGLCMVKSYLLPIMPLLTGMISLLMAIDRTMAFCKPFFYRTNINKKVWTICLIIGFSILSLLCFLPHMGFGSMWEETYRRGKVSYKCSVFTYQEERRKRIFHSLYTFIGFLLVLGIIICNAVVAGAVLLLRRRTNETRKISSHQPSVFKMDREIKFAVIVGVLAVVFVTCWLPYNVWVLYKLMNIPMKYEVVTNIHLLGGFNYSTDPFVYLIIRKSNWSMCGRMVCCRTASSHQNSDKSVPVVRTSSQNTSM